MTRYEVSAEAYRVKFRNARQATEESFKEFAVRITEFLRHWCEREEIDGHFRKLIDLIAREELVVSCDRELTLWIQEQKPMTVDELIEKAEAFQQAHKGVQVSYRAQSSSKPSNDFQNRNRGRNTQ